MSNDHTLKDIKLLLEEINLILKNLTEKQATFGDLLQKLQNIGREQRGMTQLARITGLRRENLYKTFSSKGNPQLSTFLEITQALGLQLQFIQQENYKSIPHSKSPSKISISSQLSEEWNFSKNLQLLSTDVGPGSHRKAWWVCKKGPDHEWQDTIVKRSNGAGCPICLGVKTVASNSLASTHANLAKEWNKEKNLPLKVESVRASSSKKAWWRCSKNNLHEWVDLIRNRVIHGDCPFCTQRLKYITAG